MTIKVFNPATNGPSLAFDEIQSEFGGTNPIGLDEYYRGAGRVPSHVTDVPTSGPISVRNFYGTNRRVVIPLNIPAGDYAYDVFNNRGSSYVAGLSDITVTVPSGVLVGSTATDGYAMLVPNSFNPADTVTIVNNGVIQGRGGNGGESQFAAQPAGGNAGGPGGSALWVNRPTTIQNNSVIAGGGGGGGSGAGWTPDKGPPGWGGAGGGGAGFNAGSGGGGPYAASAGDSVNGGAGNPGDFENHAGGTGGGRGAAGGVGGLTGGANPRPGGVGGAAGTYVTGGFNVTWVSNGTRLGPAG